VTLRADHRTAEVGGTRPDVQVAGVNVAARTAAAAPRQAQGWAFPGSRGRGKLTHVGYKEWFVAPLVS
jgi:hypothetical protein